MKDSSGPSGGHTPSERVARARLAAATLAAVRAAAEEVPAVAADPRARAQAQVRRLNLPPRLAAVAVEVALGEANRAIAERLGLAEATVALHVTHLAQLAGAEGRTATIAWIWGHA